MVGPAGLTAADVALADGQIVAVEPELTGFDATEEVDARGLHVFPGGVDTHVHFNEPGRPDWETFADGSAALAAGGYTAFVEMPLNSRPVTVDADSFDAKLEVAASTSLVDFGLWGGLVPGNLDQLEALVERGVAGFKAFMCSSGNEDFPAVDDWTLAEGMRRLARLGSILLVHAEDSGILDALARSARAEGRSGIRDFLRSRPAAAELQAIARAIFWAGETGCRLHVVHVSTAAGARMIGEAAARGVDVSCETCPHYLLFTSADLERLGAVAKCTPPFRSAADVAGLWRGVGDGSVPMIVSDHSPTSPENKLGDDFFQVWGGVSGCQSTRRLLLAAGPAHGLDEAVIARATARNPARRFELAGKGELAAGLDADLWLVDLSESGVLSRQELLYRNPSSLHEGQPVRGRTVRTIVRGQTVFAEGRVVSPPVGRLLRPGRAS